MNQIMNVIVSSVCPVEKGKREAFKKSYANNFDNDN